MVKIGLESTSKQLRVRMALLFCLLTTAFMALEASASVDFVNQWPATRTIVSNSNAGTITGKYTPGLGNNRLMLVAVATKYSTGPVTPPSFTVTYGGVTVNQIVATTLASAPNGLWLGYLDNTGINNGVTGGKKLIVNNNTTTNLSAMYATVAVFNGINQTTPLTGSGQNALAATATTVATSVTMAANAGLAGNNGLSIYVTNWAGTNNTSSVAGYTENRDILSASGLINLAGGYKVTTGANPETLTSTATLAYGAIAGVGLNPQIKIATISTCGDCHGNPPIDGTRNTLAGAVAGSHEKHSGGTDIQYSFTCTACHYDNGTTNYKHADGYKNITGSSLPGNAYTSPSGKRVPISNSPTMYTCTNTYCHSTARSNRQYTPPTWGGAGTTCLSCHGGRAGTGNGAQATSTAGFKLSSSHSQHLKYTATEVNCNMCHGSVTSYIGSNLTLKNYSGIIYHANGTVNVVFREIAYGTYTAFKTGSKTCENVACHGGKTRGGWQNASINTNNTCVHCHGVAATSAALANTEANRKFFAPGYGGGTSTDQLTVNTDNRVGAHFVHLSSVYSKRTKCNECHRVPATAFDGTHMTGPRFNSQSLTFDQASTAKKNSAPAAFTSGTATTPATCATTYCHGNNMPKGDSSGTARSVNWNDAARMTGSPGADCATCHGNPPLFGSSSTAHIGSVATTSCAGCHKNVANATGNIIDKSLHINGAVNMLVDTATSTSCNKCHGNPPQGTVVNYGRYSGLVKPATLALGASPANMGAHAKHASKGLSCNACHTNSTISHPDNKLQIFFRITSATITGWNATAQRAPYGTYSGNSGGMTIDSSSTLIRTTASNNNSCNTYCHGGWNNSNRNMNPKWTDAGAATACGACHGTTAAKPPLIASHARHAGYSSATTFRQGYSFACLKCHPNRSTSDHIKGAVHVRFSTAVLGANATYTKTGATLTTPAGVRLYTTRGLAGDTPDGTCSTNACHSTGRAPVGMGNTEYTTTQQWGSTTRNCLGCHGGRSGATGTGAPARSSANFTLSTTHSAHLKYPAANINCQTCHSQTMVTNAITLKNFSGVKRHANGKRDVTFTSALPYGTYTAYKSTESGSIGTARTCNNVSCHGGKSRSAWSASAQNNDNTCLHCHGAGNGTGLALRADRYNAAPGWVAPVGTGISTDGNTIATDIRVGAHYKHLSSLYVKKMKCNECHLVPTGPFDGTHMQTQRFNSQTLTFNQASTATKRTTPATFTPGTSVLPANCTNYCHGTNLLNGDTTAGTVRTPTWNQDLTTGGNCGKCHGNPPNSVTASHNGLPAASAGGCNGCHGMVVNGAGVIIDKALHMDGTINVVKDCNACHDYDTNGGTWGLVKNKNYGGSTGIEGRGAHYKHIEYLKSGIRNNGVPVALTPSTDTYGGPVFNLVCGVCHDTNISAHTTGVSTNPRSIVFPAARNFGGTATFNGQTIGVNNTSANAPKSCSNLDCHYRTSPIWSTY